MARGKGTTTKTATKTARPRTALLPAALPLGFWRLRRMWRLLLVAQLGMLSAVLLLSAVPLFTRVATVAGLRGALAALPQTPYFYTLAFTNAPTAVNLDEAGRRSQQVLQQNFAAFGISGAATLELTGSSVPIAAIDGAPSPAGTMGLYGLNEAALPGRTRIVAGRLPRPAPGVIETAVTSETARQLLVQPGSMVTLGATATAGDHVAVPLRIVGIVDPVPQAVEALTVPNDLKPVSDQYWGVVSIEAISQSAIPWAAVAAETAAAGHAPGYWQATWIYHASLAHLEQLDLREPEHYQQLRYQSGLELSNLPGMNEVNIDGQAPDVLYSYAVHLQLAQIVTFLLLIVVLGLLLLFMSLVANALVEHQQALIALLRNRGASKGQISAAFLIQNVLLGAIALVAGMLLAAPLVRIVSVVLLPLGSAGALAALDGDPLRTAEGVALPALIAVVLTVAGTIWATRRAARRTVLATLQETTRARAKPLWQRLYLDVIAALLALFGYAAFTLMTALATATPTLDSERTRELLSPLALLAPPFLTIAVALLFLRVFPAALRLGERMAAGRRGAPALLALTQLARAPRPALRITLLLALAVSFALFTLNTLTTTGWRIEDIAAHQAGADFSGSPALSGAGQAPSPSLAALAQEYVGIPGVTSATAGFRIAALQRRQQGFDNPPILQIEAVDADAFAGTAFWSTEDSSQSLSDLMALLRAGRQRAATEHVVPALLDAQLWKTLQLTQGQTFSLPTPNQATGEMRFVALREVQHIPATMSSTGFNFGPATGGMLVDYQSFAAVYASVTTGSDSAGRQILAPNFVWLNTKDDAASLASVRAALNSGPLKLTALQPQDGPEVFVSDRRALSAALHTDPMYLDVTGALALGAFAALALALLGTLIAAWLWMREQMAARALLRAVGMEPRHLKRTLLFEQGIVFGTAGVLGAALGVLLTAIATSALVDLMFSNTLGSAVYSAATSDAPPVRLALSAPLLAAGMVACVVMLASIALTTSGWGARSAIAPELRLNEN